MEGLLMKVLGITTCFNRKEITVHCISSLVSANHSIDFEFIIADDGSQDGTAEALEKFDNVVVLKGNSSLFYSGGMRLGIGHAKTSRKTYDYVMFFNDDVGFYWGAIEKLINFNQPELCIRVGATDEGNGIFTYGGVRKSSTRKPSYTYFISSETIEYVDTFNANCVLIPYEIFMELPNIDMEFQHSLGDYDYGLTASKKGVKIVVTDFFVGKCERNHTKETWLDRNQSLMVRLKKKESPKGVPFKPYFHYLCKNYGVLSAVFYSITPYIKLLMGK